MIRRVFQSPDDACAICLDPLDVGGPVTLSCGHQFHASCIFRLSANQCALCRCVGSLPVQGVMNDAVYKENQALRGMLTGELKLRIQAQCARESELKLQIDTDVLRLRTQKHYELELKLQRDADALRLRIQAQSARELKLKLQRDAENHALKLRSEAVSVRELKLKSGSNVLKLRTKTPSAREHELELKLQNEKLRHERTEFLLQVVNGHFKKLVVRSDHLDRFLEEKIQGFECE